MKTISILLIISFSALSFNLEISNLSGNYFDPSGNASVDYLNLKDEIIIEKQPITIEKQGGALFIKSEDKELEVSNLPELIMSMEELDFVNINSKVNDSAFKVSFQKIEGKKEEDFLSLKGFSLNCEHTKNNNYLDSCFNNKGQLKLQSGRYKSKKDNEFSKVLFSIDNNKMNFNIKAAGHFIKGYGESFYEDGIIKIKITKAKKGILNVTGMLFKELSKLKNERVEVKRPWIKIYLN